MNLRLQNRVLALQETCKDCYRCIAGLVDKNLTLFQEVEKCKNPYNAISRVNNKKRLMMIFMIATNEMTQVVRVMLCPRRVRIMQNF